MKSSRILYHQEYVPWELKTIPQTALRPRTILGKPPLHWDQNCTSEASVSGTALGLLGCACVQIKYIHTYIHVQMKIFLHDPGAAGPPPLPLFRVAVVTTTVSFPAGRVAVVVVVLSSTPVVWLWWWYCFHPPVVWLWWW